MKIDATFLKYILMVKISLLSLLQISLRDFFQRNNKKDFFWGCKKYFQVEFRVSLSANQMSNKN
jgi:hypothetical protein